MKHEPQHDSAGYERSDAQLAPVLWFVVGLTATVLVAFLSMRWLFDAFDARAMAADAQPHPMATTVEPPAPRLQTETSLDLIAHRERERELTTRYAWVDREAGVVRIPIERAMQLVLERGLPARKESK